MTSTPDLCNVCVYAIETTAVTAVIFEDNIHATAGDTPPLQLLPPASHSI